MPLLKNLALAIAFAFMAHIGTANASVIYDLTLAPTSGGSVTGSGTMTLSSTPSTSFNQVSDYFQGSGTLLSLTLVIGGDTFTLTQKNSGSNPMVQFVSGKLNDITYAGVAANGDSLMMTSQFVFYMTQSRQQEFGTFTAIPAALSTTAAVAVPEPASLAILTTGLVGFGIILLRRHKAI